MAQSDPPTLPASPPQLLNDVIPDLHLSRLVGKKSPRIVIVGDSISTRAPGVTHDVIDSFWGYFQRAFLLANPGLAPEFVNRAIGSTRYVQFERATLAETQAVERGLPWVEDPDARWLDIVEATEPDLLIQGFGMNDSTAFSTQGFIALQRRIDGWAKRPDRLFVTTMLPSRASDRPGIGSAEAQAGRMYNAHYVRSWALYNGYGLLDLNRVQSMAVQGFDPRVSELTRQRGFAPAYPSRFRHPCQDFGVVVESETLGDDLAAGLTIQIGPHLPGNPEVSILRLRKDAADFVLAEFADLPGALGTYMRCRSATPLNGRPQRLSVFIKDVFAHIEVDGDDLFFGRIRRHGGTFTPVIARTDRANAESRISHFTGTFRKHTPILSDIAAYGDPGGRNALTGGNGHTHPTSQLAATVFAPLLDGVRLTVPRVADNETPAGLSVRRL